MTETIGKYRTYRLKKVISSALAIAAVMCMAVGLPAAAAEKAQSDALIKIFEFEDFEDGDYQGVLERKIGTLNGNTVLKLGDNNKTKATMHTMELPVELTDAIASGTTSYRLYIKGKTMLDNDVSTKAELQLAKNGSKRRLVDHFVADDLNYYAVINSAKTANGANISDPINIVTSSGTQVTGLSESELSSWIDWTVTIEGVGDTADITYYCNGKNVGENRDAVGMTDFNQVRYFVQQNADSNTPNYGYFDDIEIYAVLGEYEENAALPDKIENVGVNESITVSYSEPIITDYIGVLIDGESIPEERISYTADKRGIIVSAPEDGYFYETIHTIEITGAKNYFGVTAKPYFGEFVVENKPVYNFVPKIYIHQLDCFDSFDSSVWGTAKGWELGNGTLVSNHTENTTSTYKLAKLFPEELSVAIKNNTAGKLLFRSKVKIIGKSGDETVTPTFQIGLTYGGELSQSLARLVQIRGKGSTTQLYIGGTVATPTIMCEDIKVGAWNDIVIAIDMDAAGGATASFYLNGSRIGEDISVMMSTISDGETYYADAVTIMTQSGMGVEIDDFEAYGTLEGIGEFIVTSIEPSENIEPNEKFVITFSNEIDYESFSSAIFINGENVDSERLSYGNNVRSIVISAPTGGYDTCSTNILTIRRNAVFDVFGTVGVFPELSFTVGGDPVTAKADSISVNGNVASSDIYIRNVSGESVDICVLLVEQSNEEIPQLESIKIVRQTISSDQGKTIIPISSNLTNPDSMVKLMICYGDTFIPILEIPVTNT